MSAQAEKQTGYPSIDKPWLKYYTDEMKEAVLPELSMYQYVYENNREHGGYTALNYFGRKISYAEFFGRVRAAAQAFKKMGVRKGSTVTIMSMHTPETIVSIYALNYLGAVANMIYMTLTSKEIIEYINKTESVMFMYFITASDTVVSIKDEIKVPVVYFSPVQSMPFVLKTVLKLKSSGKPYGESFSDFVEWGRNEELEEVEVSGDDPAVIVYTSGTTGEPKGVVHTNNSLNATPFQYKNAGMELNPGDTFLNAIPPFLGFGISIGMHTQLALGTQGILQIVPEAKAVAEKFIKSKPDHMIIGPAFVSAMIDICGGDMSWLRTLAGGGGAVSVEQENELNERLKKSNCKIEYTAGYGMTEFGATVCTNMNRCNRPRSLGIPFAKTNIKILDPDTAEELRYGETGEMCFNTPNMMRGYWNHPEKDQFMIIDGEKWFRTGDLGHVDTDGFVYFDGRLKRIYITRGKDTVAYKVFPQRVEDEICKNPAVDFCATIALDDEERVTVLVSYVKLKDGMKSTAEEIMSAITGELPDYSLPVEILFIDDMPTTQSGKIDYRELEKRYLGE